MRVNSGEASISKPDLLRASKNHQGSERTKTIEQNHSRHIHWLIIYRLIKYLEWMSDKGFVELDSNGEVLLTKLGPETYDRLVNWILKYVGKVRFPKFSE